MLTRYEAATFNELLLSHLLSPVGGGPLSQFVSQQEYSKLFEKDGVGFASDSVYFSTGEFRQTASQFGTVGNLSYALDGYYLHGRGPRLYNRLTTAGGFATFKLQLGPQDTVFFQTAVGDTETGDVAQRYDPNEVKHSRAALTHDFQEKQDPGLLLLGWQHEWSPGNHTLLLLGRLASRQSLTSQQRTQSILDTDVTEIVSAKLTEDLIRNRLVRDRDFFTAMQRLAGRGVIFDSVSNIFDLDYRASFETWSADLQHIATLGPDTVVLGGRYQRGQFETSARLTNFANGDGGFDTRFYDDPPAAKSASVDFERINLYLYNVLHVTPWLSLSGGIAYDSLRYPDNFRVPPINDRQANFEHLSPKAGFTLRPWSGALLRGAFTESVSGTSFDESIRLEPAQVAGFVQSYRSLVSESLTGAVAGSKYRLFGLSFEQKLRTRTYLGIEWNVNTQTFDRTLGVFERAHIAFRPLVVVPSSLAEKDRYREDSIAATVNQLFGERWSLGARYRYTHSNFRQHRDGYGEALDRPGNSAIARENLAAGKSTHTESGLHELGIFALYNHPSGFFARAEANWYRQRNDDFISANDSSGVRLRTANFGLAGDDFWQVNAMAGWRFHRNQCELSGGLLNLAGQDYRLSPLNPHEDLARDRTLVLRCRLSF